MSDGTKRKLTMPPWHLPYLEKHRIYGLFHELARELVIQQPVDHVLFLKQILYHAAQSRDTARVIIISSPKINAYEVARKISYTTKQTVVGNKDLMDMLDPDGKMEEIKTKMMVKCLNYFLRTETINKTGWILVDCIKNGKEAIAILREGILPTHVFHLIPSFIPPFNELLYCHVSEGWPEYRRNIMAVRDAFKHCLMEVHLGQRNIDEVVGECLKLIKIKKGYGGPKQPRVLILGPRGCGRKTQARMLADNHSLIHVDFEYLLCQAWVSQTELGEKLRSCKDEVCFESALLSQVVNQRILEQDCLEKGWVLTGYPYTVADFKFMDCLDTPPNRVIFLECDMSICKERVLSRSVNVHTGSIVDVSVEPQFSIGKVLAQHPKDRKAVINAELNYYCQNYGALRSYCGETGSVVNGDQPPRWVYECVTAIIVRPAPPCPPRNPYNLDEDTDSKVDTDTTTDRSHLFNSFVTLL